MDEPCYRERGTIEYLPYHQEPSNARYHLLEMIRILNRNAKPNLNGNFAHSDRLKLNLRKIAKYRYSYQRTRRKTMYHREKGLQDQFVRKPHHQYPNWLEPCLNQPEYTKLLPFLQRQLQGLMRSVRARPSALRNYVASRRRSPLPFESYRISVRRNIIQIK